MGYLSINNLYKDQTVMLFKQVYALEKVHGSSSHIAWNKGVMTFFAGGAKHESFVALFDQEKLKATFTEEFGVTDYAVTIYGEVYGGKMQAMSATYGKDMKFIAFDVQVGESWLVVPHAHEVVKKFNLEFVDYSLVDATVEALDAERLKESTQAVRNGCGSGRKREGIVIRPPIEVKTNNGARVIAKHKNANFEERATPQKIVDPSQLKVLEEVDAIVNEWCTAMRLEHALDKVFPNGETPDIAKMGILLKYMVEDILREASGEIVDSKELRGGISKKTAQMFKDKIKSSLYNKE